MGLFDDVNILPQPAEDSTLDNPKVCTDFRPLQHSRRCGHSGSSEPWHCLIQVDLTLNIVERKTGGLSAGGGISAQGHAEGALPGFIGSCSYSQRNLFGLNQKLSATVELGQVGFVKRVWNARHHCERNLEEVAKYQGRAAVFVPCLADMDLDCLSPLVK
jgi:hypothetical protein